MKSNPRFESKHTAMESSLSSSSLTVQPHQGTLLGGEHEDGNVENQNQTMLRHNEDGENDTVNNIRRQSNVSLSLAGKRSSSCNDISSRLQRRGTEQESRRHLLEAQPQQQHQQLESEGLEPEVVLPATNTTMSRKSLFVLRPVHRYVDLVCIGLSVLAYLLETTMNAALAIFGIGVGVGLVLGDSFRAALPMLPSVQLSHQQQQQQNTAIANTATMAATTAQAGSELLMPRSVSNLLPAQ